MSTLLLAGVAASALFSAATSTVLSFSNDYQMRQMVFWMMGGLAGRGYEHVQMITPPILLGSAAMLVYARDLNVMLLGEEGARGVGLDSQRSQRILLTLSAFVTGAAVSVTGTIGFVGLIVPHVLRLLVGPDHRVLLPVSALGGASFLILADLAARVVVRPVELQVGIVTAFVGAPYFIYLLRRSRSERGFCRMRDDRVPAVELVHWSVTLDGRAVLSDINLSAYPGELVGLVGPNGAGKSTLLRSIIMMPQPAVGAGRVFGRDIGRMSTTELARMVALMPQNLVLSFPFPAEEVVMMGRHPHLSRFQRESDEDWQLVRESMSRTDTAGLCGRIVTSLSGGETQLVSMAKTSPRLLL